jgi:hypothetical protein
MLAYAGSNVGNGPTIWTTLLPGLVATVILLGLWVMLELTGGARDAITIDHDLAAAVRVAGMLIGCGAILGRAMAGDWHGYGETWAEFIRLGWPVLPLVAFTAAMNRLSAPTPFRPHPPVLTAGVLPAAVLIALAGAYVIYLGVPEVAPVGMYKP